MRVEFCESVDVKGMASIGVDDIACALRESLSDASNADESERWRESSLKSLVSSVHQVLSAIDREMIETINDEQRQMIFDGLSKEIQRWKT